ncbi:hypothetical protein [Thermococcus indicus]|uniref:hypothetical protein n=1 Tax=Thermococcus indicus TaxID=2586643 RepID=UPI00143D56E8|nr:hypothetical protein [Thermococcus indicus]
MRLRKLKLRALRVYLILSSRKRRKNLPIEDYMGVFGEASPEELNGYALEFWFPQ